MDAIIVFSVSQFAAYFTSISLVILTGSALCVYNERKKFKRWAAQNGCALPPPIRNPLPISYGHKFRTLKDKSDVLDVILRQN